MSPAQILNLPDKLAIAPQAEVTADGNGTGVDISAFDGVLGFELGTVNIAGTSPTLDVKLQHCDTLAGSYVDITGGAFVQATDANTKAAVIQTIKLDKNALKKYVRAVDDIGGSSSPKFSRHVTLHAHKKYKS